MNIRALDIDEGYLFGRWSSGGAMLRAITCQSLTRSRSDLFLTPLQGELALPPVIVIALSNEALRGAFFAS